MKNKLAIYRDKMRILILTNSDTGLYKFRKELLQELTHPESYIERSESEPCEVFISSPKGAYVAELQKIGCMFINTSVDRRGMNPIKDLKLLNEYRKIINQIKPDIVLTYTIKPNIYGGIICSLKKIPYISNITGLGTSIENGGIISKVILFLYKMGLNAASVIFFQNNANKIFFEKKNIIKKQGILIPGSGVNLNENCFEEYPDEKKKIKFLFVGRIMKDKGINEFLNCAEYIHGIYPDTQFSIVGPYDEESYSTRINELHQKGTICYYGQQQDVHSFMKDHSAIILPTYHEGLSNVLLESSATGRPVLASNIPGCEETFDDGITGIGFTAKSSQSLIDVVEMFLHIPYEKRKMMGLKAREKVEKEFDKKQVVKAYINAINKVKNDRGMEVNK